ncbi:hypothetical protein ACNSOS_01870 [Aliarcobacter vitoriensis]|uniref:hypothetical protein n=1 Tax=Aliarcobacter vitoriensis TaxID=2011099 RepID=UPI000DEBFB54|nr:hypothetical protein CRU92_06770 [Arcobacter sp. FW59]
MKNTIKVVFLGLVGFALLVYLTIPDFSNEDEIKQELSLNDIPNFFDVIGKNPYTKKDELFKNSEQSYIIVLNHDSLAIFKDLYKKTNKNIVLVANISNTPWLIKQIAINGELEKMYQTSKIPLINDSDGSFIKALRLDDNSQNSYFVYTIFEDGSIERLFKSSVKKGALQDGITNDEIDINLDEFFKNLNKFE